jgi:hypothetical protein
LAEGLRRESIAQQVEKISVTLVLDKGRVAKLQNSFPESDDIQSVATTIAELMTNEFIDLLAGEKRYLSLSHQYIEWLQQLYEAILPDEEYTYERLYNNFNFPPGTAQYMARVLRGRQNTALHHKAKARLQNLLSSELEEYEKLPDNEKVGAAKMRSMKFTTREFDLLQMTVDRLVARDEEIEYPRVTSRSKRFVVITYHVDHIAKILPEIEAL